jgi:outer membrane protein with beta-barrel domain
MSGFDQADHHQSCQPDESAMKKLFEIRTIVCWLALCVAFAVPNAFSQRFEITGQLGGQWNGGLDLSTANFLHFDVGNSKTYGLTAGYLPGKRFGVEFQWNYSFADITVQSPTGGNVKLVGLNSNQYLGNFVYHFADKESKLRPFAFLGLGANDLRPGRSEVRGLTRFVGAFGGGAKYSLSRHFGLRLQAKWSPTYINTTRGGYWCDPFWGGCWAVGNSHFLHEVDATGGITFRF